MEKYRRMKGDGIKSNLNRSNSVFKPLIASSLALALGVSVASATTGFYQQNSDGSQGTAIQLPSGVSFETTTIESAEYTIFKVNQQVEDEFKLYVTAGQTRWIPDAFSNKGQFDIQSNSMLVSDKGIAMGNTGNGTLTLDLWTAAGDNSTKSFILDLSGVSSTSYAFYGNLSVTGNSSGSDENYSKKTLLAKFGGKGIKGNLALSSKAKTKFVFEQDANIEGNINIENNPNVAFAKSQGILKVTGSIVINDKTQGTLTFEDSTTITGGIRKSGGSAKRKTGAKTTIFFNGNENLISGGIEIPATTENGHNVIDITFGDSTINNTISGNISSTGGGYRSGGLHTNKITFKGSGKNEIIGNITAKRDAWGGNGQNDITFATGGSITGDITAESRNNVITFQGEKDALITGNVVGKYSVRAQGAHGQNTVNMNSSNNNKITGDVKAIHGTNDITMSGRKAVITGDIVAGSEGYSSCGTSGNTVKFQGQENSVTNITTTFGNNSVYFSGNTNLINGNISADGGTNNITATNLTFQNPRSITAGTGGYTSINRFDISGNMTFNNSSTLVIKASNTANTNTDKHNIFKFGGNISKSYIAELSAVSASGDLTKTKNILSFDGLSTATTLSIGYINKTTTINSHSTGYNYIGKGLTTGSGSSLALSFEENNWNQSRYQAENLALNVTGDIYAKYGKNFINVGSVEVGGEIDGNGGHNYIATSRSFTSGAIKARWGGSNNIIIGGNATIASISAAPDSSSNDKSQSINNITFSGNNSVNAVLGDIIIGSASTTAQNNFTLSGNGTTLTLNGKASGGTNHEITSLTATTSGESTLTLDNSNVASGAMATKIHSITNGSNLNVVLKGKDTTNTATLTLDNATGTTLKSVGLGTGAKGNTLTFNAGENSITEKIIVGSTQDLTLNLAGTTTSLNLAGGLNGGAVIKVNSSNATTLSGGAIDGATLSFADSKALTLKNTSAIFTTVDASAGSATLTLDGTSSAVTATINTISGEDLAVTLAGASASNKATLNLNGGSLKSVSATAGNTNANIINFNSGTTTINTISGNDNGLTLNLKGGNLILSQEIAADGPTTRANHISVDISIDGDSTLSLAGKNNTIHSLSGNGGTIDFVGTSSKASSKASSARKTLTTNTLSGNLNAIVFASRTEADQIIVTDTNSSGTLTISAQGDINEILSITQDDKVVVAKVGSNSNVNVQGGESVIDGIVLDLIVNPDESKGDYLIGKSVAKGVDTSIQAVASSTLTVNYDLYLANFNSLNKRMGELRDNPYSQGVWARVFGGAMSNDIGSGSKSEYVTAQAGYDYSLTLGNAKNYMGIALAYGSSLTKANEGVGLSSATLDNINSRMVEVGIYNSYVMDSGWYNDTIFKFDYIMSEFDISIQSSGTSSHSTNNFAMVLSNEFGYRYKFAENEKGNWYIDPQVEVAFGYFNQSDFNHVLNTQSNIVMKATQDSILTLRSRAGMSLGKKFVTDKGFASLYVGAFYEYDYIEGGEAQTQTLGISNPIDKLESNGRAILNIGSNIELTEGVRMYIDVEKSFGDKQRTFMQFNLGARYSF